MFCCTLLSWGEGCSWHHDRSAAINPLKCFSLCALIHKGRCQSFLGRVPTRTLECALPPPSATQIAGRCLLRTDQGGVAPFTLKFHILLSAEWLTGNVANELWEHKSPRPIRSLETRDSCDEISSPAYCTAQYFFWKSWHSTTTTQVRESLQLPLLTVSEAYLTNVSLNNVKYMILSLYDCSFEIRGAFKLLPALTRPKSEITFQHILANVVGVKVRRFRLTFLEFTSPSKTKFGVCPRC